MNRMRSILNLTLIFITLLFVSCEKEDFATVSQAEVDVETRAPQPVDIYALTNTGQINILYYNGTLSPQGSLTISGLQASEAIVAIDFRPATGQLYGVSNQSRIYMINLNTGVASAITLTPFTPALNGAAVGFDFNPTVDRIRLVTNNEQNLRLNPETGTVAFTDGSLNSTVGTIDVQSVAYTNSFAGSTTTVLYDIELLSDQLFKQNPPNSGTLELVGSLTIDAVDAGGFDISPDNKTAIANLRTFDSGSNSNVNHFYAINLTTGEATQIAETDADIIGVAIRTLPVAYAISKTNTMLIFNPLQSGTPISKPLTGLQAGESILGIDMRPATGQLYALGSTSRIYAVNMSNGAATAVGPQFTPLLSGSHFGFDFNPTVDRIRIVSSTGQNLRAHPATGAIALVDGALNPGTPTVDAVAYTNSFAGATTTTLYDIDFTTDKLFVQNPPNSGTLVTVGNLGINASSSDGFDIGGTSGDAYGLITNQFGQTILYSIDLTSGQATPGRRFSERVNGFTIGLGF